MGGTILSTLVFSLLTWLLVLVGIVKRAHLGSSPLLSCLLYGALLALPVVSGLEATAEHGYWTCRLTDFGHRPCGHAERVCRGRRAAPAVQSGGWRVHVQ